MQGTIGELRIFGGNYAPRDWAFCQGQLLPIVGNEALYSLLGTAYGGDGRTNFGLPDFRGRIAVGSGDGPGLTSRPLGQRSGQEFVTLTEDQIPAHKHHFTVSKNPATTNQVTDKMLAAPQDPSGGLDVVYYLPDTPETETLLPLREDAIRDNGGDEEHENRQPFVVVNYIICMKGLYPQFS